MNISEVASRQNITPATLRYYEQQGLITPIKRTTAGVRDYSNEDLKWIEFIKCMRNSGLSIDALARYTELFQKGDMTLKERKEILVLEYEKLLKKQAQINETVAKLAYKINNYEVKINHSEIINTAVQKTTNYAGSVEDNVSFSKN
ncbi:MerR family transcriptional regulator [Listeria sp. FSL L7-1485]|uniref:MerR family transcriptional regulator n=1 Tax=Listeria immobilis TaxID=2713502 RepID=A0A7X0X6N5_9LIST|nr:MerR family transcriptional regulator [Listeria immobilis]MBC1482653.1 MerR family transcriptional regulator [Listeria immobilis]MBC1488323.1 MerR family transcriptional regulator [Listeria immobilis]MBC1507173.1 MerR family transcriptional regulator [Listeria immobilis]MBC1509915.1 MerR family transcriptional regulator [Listeria immobilis]MBC1516310.1 MerR family transcriptional regulator [Listeria immobilis]